MVEQSWIAVDNPNLPVSKPGQDTGVALGIKLLPHKSWRQHKITQIAAYPICLG